MKSVPTVGIKAHWLALGGMALLVFATLVVSSSVRRPGGNASGTDCLPGLIGASNHAAAQLEQPHNGTSLPQYLDALAPHALAKQLRGAVAACGGPSASPTTTPPASPGPTASTPSPAPSPSTSGFHGVFDFPTGHVDPSGPLALANNPSVAGALEYYPWSAVEKAPNSLDVARIRQDAKPWTDAHKRYAVRIMSAVPGVQATPAWVGAPHVGVYPVYWDARYLAATQALASELATAFDGDPSVAWVQIGLGVYGESKVEQTPGNTSSDLGAWTAQGYSDARWLATMATICGYYRADFTRTPLVVATNASFIGGSGMRGANVVAMLAPLGIEPQEDGWKLGSVIAGSWSALAATTGGVLEQYLSSAQSSVNNADADLRSIVAAAGQVKGGTTALIYDTDLALLARDGTLAWAGGQVAR